MHFIIKGSTSVSTTWTCASSADYPDVSERSWSASGEPEGRTSDNFEGLTRRLLVGDISTAYSIGHITLATLAKYNELTHNRLTHESFTVTGR